MEKSYVTAKNLCKFLFGSAFGVLMFLVPIPQGESFTTLLDFLKSWIKGLFGASLPYIIMAILVVSAVVSLYDYIAKPDWIRKNHYLSRAFSTTPLYLVSKIIGAVFAVMVVFKIGPVVRPLFHVPGRASIDLIASWFGASNAAVILTREQYMKGFYTRREAGYIMTNFSLVSIPFCLMVADTMGISNIFPPFYLCICVVGIILAVIIARIPPICTIPNTYREAVGKQIDEDIPQEKGVFAYALEMSCKRADKFTAKTVVTSGFEVLVGMFFDLIPIVVSWGTIALIIATYTPFFSWISYPMGMYLQALGVPESFAAAPATLVGFTDMFIPALLSVGLTSVKTKFVVGVLSLVQIIYLTEVGTIIIKSEIPLNFWKLLVIFLERTLVAIPLIVLFANMIGL